jgi:galactofuranosylgalactofuranosylrhamnosyl-N-acetylglucosaminyl-diphospho-decaprenol beta-1,5/1,6-galactofuranosyltransferase
MTDQASDVDAQLRVLQRVVFPLDRDLDVMPLYVEGGAAHGAATADDETLTRMPGQSVDELHAQTPTTGHAPDTMAPMPAGEHQAAVQHVTGRRSLVVPAGSRISLGTYFNAFPASYWRRWTHLSEVTLRVRLSGDATVVVYRSTAKGHSQRVESVRRDTEEPRDLAFNLSLRPFIDGGWYWFDLAAGERDVVLDEADWCAYTDRRQHGRLTIAITTFNRPEFCVAQLNNLGQAEAVMELVDEILVIDQGTNRVEEDPGFEPAAKVLGEQLRIVSQGNIGGSGGFSRGMYEAVQADRSDYVLLLDDDVITEPEGILRAMTFADLARKPTIVGGQMFSLYDRSVLHAYGEAVNQYRFFWGPAPGTYHGQDFSRRSLRRTPWLHRRVDVDYNGWWMCLIPTSVIKEIGLALPLFIKWDDCEFGLRAGEAGHPTVTLPGVAVWHVPWHEKDDTIDWQAYFHERNRLIGALLHSPYPRGGSLIKESAQVVVKHLLSMQYSAAELMLLAIEDLLAGPGRLHPDIVVKMAQLRAVRSQFADAQTRNDLEAFPAPRRRKPLRRGKQPRAPKGHVGLLKTAAVRAARQVVPPRPEARTRPEAAIPHYAQRWWLLSQFDSALVSSADGISAAWYHRDPQRFRSLLSKSAMLHTELVRQWPRLRQQYRDAMPEVTSPRQWVDTFAASSAPSEPARKPAMSKES